MAEKGWLALFIGLIVFMTMGTGSVSALPVFNAANGHYYELADAPYITWVDARDAAAAAVLEGTAHGFGHLATITSAEENAFVTARYGAALSNKWIGGFQGDAFIATADEGWAWVTGEPWEWTSWNSGEPNNMDYGSYYGYESVTTFWDGNGLWNDAPRLWQYSNGGYLIEWDCIPAQIDIKPGSFPNSINAGERGTVPVAVLGSAVLDVTTIDPASIELGGVSVETRGSAKSPRLTCSYEDVNSDGFTDLVVHFNVSKLGLTGSETMLALTAQTSNGEIILSSDSVNLVPA
jgi:hypothetical protein